MADTMRTLSQVAALLADNVAGDISPQDLRDALLATVQPGHGEISITTPAATTIPDTVTWVPAAGTWALTAGLAMNWDMNTQGQLRYVGAEPRVAHIAASFSLTAAANNVEYSFGVAKNGTIITPSIIKRKIGTGADVGAAAAHAFINVATNDYLTFVVRGDTDTTSPTLQTVNLFAMDMAM